MTKKKLMAIVTSASMALSWNVPLNVSAISELPTVELYETYTLEEFIELDEETVISIHQQLAPDIDAAG